MKKLLFLILTLCMVLIGYSQSIKVAILDFENTSGKTEYDALGKAMSSMLITDLKNNINSQTVDFFERSQLNKLLNEQKLQKSKNFDIKTAVKFGKVSGVNYVFVGTVFVLNGKCNITSKLVEVQTSKIIFAKNVNGNIESWLQLKTDLAETLANELNNPINIDKDYKEINITLSTLNQYAKLLTSMDKGDVKNAEQLRKKFEETNPNFKYFFDLKEDIENLKIQVEKNKIDIEVLKKSGGRVVNAKRPRELVVNYANPLTTELEQENIVMDLLKFDLDTITEAEWGEFKNVELPYIRGFGWGDSLSWTKAFRFIENCFQIKNKNSKSFSYYVFSKLISFAAFITNCDESGYPYTKQIKYCEYCKLVNHSGLIEKAISILDKLDSYLIQNGIQNSFELKYFNYFDDNYYIFHPESKKCRGQIMPGDLTTTSLLNFLNTRHIYKNQ